jgi:hypothetical protein
MLDVFLSYVPPSLHSAYLGQLAQIPDSATRFAVVGASCGAVGYLLKKRPGTHVVGAEADARLSAIAAQILDGVFRSESEVAQLPDGGLDAILLCNLEDGLDEAMAWLACFAPKLGARGHVYALFGSPALARPGAVDAEGLERIIGARLGELGFSVYLRWPVVESAAVNATPSGVLLAAVGPDYNPVLHARDLRSAGNYAAAHLVLDQIPASYLSNLATCETVGLEKLAILGEWIRLARGHDVSILLSRALDEYNLLSDALPYHPEAYAAMAACWEGSGDTELAARLLRTIHFAVPTDQLAENIARMEAQTPTFAPEPERAPEWEPAQTLRVLFVMNPRPHYGLDVLFDGLCACLGDENVVDFPWKPTLHGGDTAEHRHYPCRFNHDGAPATLEAICAALRAGAFDCILFGDLEGDLPPTDVSALLNARGDCPVFIVDAVDQMGNYRERVQSRIGLPEIAGYFKREMHRAVNYGPNTWPMPFSFAGERGLLEPGSARRHAFFWAGHRQFGQRRIYLETLEQRFGWNLNASLDQETYQGRLRDSRIGLNCFGMGFDTVRYWELPAQGCMLLSDELPIRIPHNFENGVNAVFFGDLGELVEKLNYYLQRPDEVASIAEAGRLHFQRYHTNQARAAQLLGRVQSVLQGKRTVQGPTGC